MESTEKQPPSPAGLYQETGRNKTADRRHARFWPYRTLSDHTP